MQKHSSVTRKARNRRRGFLKESATLALLGSGGLAMGGKLDLIGSALAAQGDYSGLNDYKALVCVFLYGGSDSFNMFLPADQNAFDAYSASRGGLAVPAASVLGSLSGTDPIGFNPNLGALKSLYDNGSLAVVQNVGNLIAPVSRSQYLGGYSAVPEDLFAHNHQQEQWQKGMSSMPTSLVSSGWGGRMADLLEEANQGSLLPPTFSLSGANHWQPGRATTPVTLNTTTGLDLMPYMDNQSGGSRNDLRDDSLRRVLGLERGSALKRAVASSFTRARDGSRAVRSVLANNPDFATPYDTRSRLASQLRMVARLIAGRDSLSMRRQIYFVGLGGWDTHDNQAKRLDLLTAELNDSLASFNDTLVELGVHDSVTTFTASDFGRTLTTNGDGSDHGWGGNQLVMGGAVNGGRLFGRMPSFQIGGDDDAGDKGRVIPSTSINQLGASLAGWMGLGDSDLNDIFPDLSNFGSNPRLALFGNT